MTGKMAAAPERTAATHKEDSELSTSQDRVPTWQDVVISWYAGGLTPAPGLLRQAAQHGLPERPPRRSKDRVRALSLAGFDAEQIMAAVPELHPVNVAELIDRIPGVARSIFGLHAAGHTPLEISQLAGVSRPKVYYWLKQVGFKPNVRNHHELTMRQRAQIAKAYGNGESMTTIARRFQVSYDQVRYAVRSEL